MVKGRTLAITDTATEVKIDALHLLIVNDGADTVWVQIEQGTDYPEQVTADDTKFMSLDAGDFIVMDTNIPIKAFSLICDTGDTASVRYQAWQ